jgi:hypothetical protein
MISNVDSIKPLVEGAQLEPCDAADGDQGVGGEWSLVIKVVWPPAGAGQKVSMGLGAG